MIHRAVRPILLLSLASCVFTGCIVGERRHRRAVVYTPAPPPPVVVQAPPPPPPGSTEVIVTGAPPPPPTEVVIEAPGPGYLWIPGVWVWSGRWVWEAGHYVRPPRAGAVWVPHHYSHRGGVHVWVRGGWRF